MKEQEKLFSSSDVENRIRFRLSVDVGRHRFRTNELANCYAGSRNETFLSDVETAR